MRAQRRFFPNLVSVLLMWLLPLCAVANSGLEFQSVPGSAPKISCRWDFNGTNNIAYVEKGVHHIPPAHRHTRHHQTVSVAATTPPLRPSLPGCPLSHYSLPAPPYLAAFPFDTFPEITVPPPELSC